MADKSLDPTQVNLDEIGEKEGYILDTRAYESETDVAGLKTASDGHTILIPQPSSSPDDPLNWSPEKKRSLLIVMSATSFIADYGSSLAAVTLLPQALEWNLSQNTVQHNLVGNIMALGGGGLVVVAMSSYFGRLPVLLGFLSASLGTAAWCSAATTFESFLAARILNGFFCCVAQAGGLMFIKDMYFFHEHPRKINIWAAAVILSPYLGPFSAAFIIWKLSWRWAFRILTILNAVCWILVVSVMDETFYNRSIPEDQQPPRTSRLLRLVGIEQWRNRRTRNTFSQAVMRPIIAISKLPVLLTCIFYLLNFAWVIGVNATLSVWLTSFYKFNPKNLGLFYFAGIVGAILGEVIGHWVHDFLGTLYMKRHKGRIEPEARLIITWFSMPLMVVSLIVMGFAMQHTWHYMILAVFWAMQIVGIMVATTAINAYLLDAYPEGSGEVGAWIAFGRTSGGFMATYIEINWVTSAGLEKAFGIQAGITVAASLIILFLQIFGKRVRRAQGRMNFATY